MNITLFLGAGFSAAFGLPTMKEFLRYAQDSAKLSEDDKKLIDELRLHARRANSFLQSSPTNLEDILSFALMAERLRLPPLDSGQTASRLRSILQRVFGSVASVDTYWKKLGNFQRFLGFDLHEAHHQITLVTTNYDLNAECALHRMRLGANLGFEYEVASDGKHSVTSQLYAKSGVRLLKLHGSINWFEKSDEPGTIVVEGRVVEVHGPITSPGRTFDLPLACAGNYEAPREPLIIPPSYLKPELHPALRHVWSLAARALSSADHLVFVGYSFPPSDTEMRYFLASALVDNPRLRRILIVDPQASEIASRLKAEQSSFGSHFKELLESQSKDWEMVNLSFGR